MKRLGSAVLRSLVRRAQTRIGQKANRMVGQLVARPTRTDTLRIARRVHNLLRRIGYTEQNYKTCLLTEAQCLRAEAAYGPPGPAWAGVYMPAVRPIGYQIRRNLLEPLRIGKTIWRQALPNKNPAADGLSAGLFWGMNYRFCSTNTPGKPEPNRYNEITSQAQQLLRTYQAITPTNHGQGAIGILISCYKPEAFIKDFLRNLHELATPERLVPVVINAGMSAECEATIQASLAEGRFHQHHFLNRPGSGIYQAWNEGIEALGSGVEFITNFNVDDRRHPLCLNVQAECLNAFSEKQVAITDYYYFFKILASTEDLYAANGHNSTLIPVVNQRTLLDRNFPHSSPLWRRSLHNPDACGLFNASYQSAGDAEFWYRVSQKHPNSFAVVSIPLSLYYQNPKGLSTRPQTTGIIEHQSCTQSHYNHVINLTDRVARPKFAQNHLHPTSPEHLQLYAYISALKAATEEDERAKK